MRRSKPSWVVVLAVSALIATSCGGGKGAQRSTPNKRGPAVDASACGLAALRKAPKPVDVTMWYELTSGAQTPLVTMADEFNASQSDVHVKLVNQNRYEDMLPKFRAGLQTGDLPDVLQGDNVTLQTVVDSKRTVPVEACVKADHYDLSDFLPRAIAAYSIDGVLEALPWNISNPILIFDEGKLRKAGLDPAKPPTTLAEIRDASRRIVASGAAKHGIALALRGYLVEHMFAKSDVLFVNHRNGRQGRTDGALLESSKVGREIFAWWKDMVDSGLALYTGTDQTNHLLAIGTGDAAMTIEGSGVLGPIRNVLEAGQYPGLKLAAGPMPTVQPGGGVSVGDGAFYLVDRDAPEKVAAAWKFVKFLAESHNVARIAAAGGYVPVRQSSTKDPVLEQTWAAYPSFRVAYDQLLAGPDDDATAGPVIGDYQGVRLEVEDALAAMVTQGLSPTDALARAQRGADTRIRAYNDRLGT